MTKEYGNPICLVEECEKISAKSLTLALESEKNGESLAAQLFLDEAVEFDTLQQRLENEHR